MYATCIVGSFAIVLELQDIKLVVDIFERIFDQLAIVNHCPMLSARLISLVQHLDSLFASYYVFSQHSDVFVAHSDSKGNFPLTAHQTRADRS